MTLALVILALLLALAGLALYRVRARRYRFDAPDVELARQRIDAIRAMPAPDELPRAPDPTRADRRRFTYRQHPIARKRSGRRI